MSIDETSGPWTRLDVSFTSDGDTCAAWLYLPPADGPVPVIVMAHGLGAVREMRLDAFAERFTAAGYACLVFDYRHFGASGGQPRQLLDIGRQLVDWRAAVAYARTRPELDPDRVVVWGTSFSGGHAIVTAAADDRLAAAIAQCPFTDGFASLRAIEPRTVAKISARAVRDVARRLRRRPPVMIATSGPVGSTALMTAPDAMDGYLALTPGAPTFSNQVAARIGLAIGLHFPGRSAAKVTVPILYCVCDRDSVAPAPATLRHVAKSPRGEIRRYDEGHFDIYVDEAFEQVVTDQLDFLRRHVPVAG
ncbi:alpha/beta hydrolase [Gordonia humi]|uniref:Dienelactone hydrolase n=1 Tax=Gordonia humi TaxID=686429 RepID=A0A840EQU8_9ACTN|nr:alpha/beta fold hydrolase [Gordonia humi]MBB4134082.1 dienelactone hydrolase [Gordonia humi]